MKKQWKPIDTAPVDPHTLILLYDKNKEGCGTEMFTGRRALAYTGIRDEYEPVTTTAAGWDFVKATHWMPCPPIP